MQAPDGDGRFLLNQAETLFALEIDQPLEPAELAKLLHRRMAVYDKDREGHYNLISALHKAMRGSDPQASLYYLARMLVAGEEPLYVLRRIVRFASEDIGLADPQALIQCLAAKDAYEFLGSPEGELAIVQACLYCATAPKSNAAYAAQKKAWKSAKQTGSLMPPPNILNAPTQLMKDIGYGKGYSYDHEQDDGFSGDNYWPEQMEPEQFYAPVDRGFEHKIRERLDYWEKLRREKLASLFFALSVTSPGLAQSGQEPSDYDRALAAGYKAQFTCSGRWNGGKSLKDIEADELTGIYDRIAKIVPDSGPLNVDEKERQVKVVLFGNLCRLAPLFGTK